MTTQPLKRVQDRAPPPPAPLPTLNHHFLIPGHPALVFAPLKVILQSECNLKLKQSLLSPLLKSSTCFSFLLEYNPKTSSPQTTRLDVIWLCSFSEVISYHFLSPSFLTLLQMCQAPSLRAFECSAFCPDTLRPASLQVCSQIPPPQRSPSHSSYGK